MDALQYAEFKMLLTKILAQTGKKAPTLLPSGKIPTSWEVVLLEKGWTKEQFAVQIKQREPGWPESDINIEGCWSEANAGKATADMVALFKKDNPDLFKEE